MTQAGPLSWRTGAGWIVLAGDGQHGPHDWDGIYAAILGWAIPGRPAALILTAGGSSMAAENLLECWADLGGANGYIVPIYTPGDAHRLENCELLADAGLVYLADGPNVLALLRVLGASPALDAIAQAFDDGAPVVAAGVASAPMGAWVADPAGRVPAEPGWAWVQDVVIAPRFTGAQNAENLRGLLAAHPDCLGLGIPEGTALALGPRGRVETLGVAQATVVLGQQSVG